VNDDLRDHLARELAQQDALGLRRELTGRGDGLADFTTNDVLGLARDPAIAAAVADAARTHGAGTAASRLLGGDHALHRAAERACAEWLGAESALLFPSGFQANLGLLQAFAEPGVLFVSDAANHASIVDGCRMARAARAHVVVTPHRDVAAVERALANAESAPRRFVVTESVFSMDGDRAPIEALLDVCERHDAHLFVDEAHAVGLLGPAGAGVVAELAERGVDVSRVAARLVTGGKALGQSGAFVVGDTTLRAWLIQRARSLMFTTAPPPSLAAGLIAAIQRARAADAERTTVLRSARRLAAAMDLPEPDAAIVPFVVGSSERALELAERARAAGLDVRAVRHPTVPRGTERLRFVLHAFNTDDEIDRLVSLLRDAARPAASSTAARSGRSRAIVVVGTDTNIGKTVVSALLMRHARARGNARYFKPVQTGTDSDTRTVAELAGLARHEWVTPLHELPLPASPHEAAAAAGTSLDPEALLRGIDRVRTEAHDAALVIELAGGLRVPYTLRFDQGDLLERAALPLVLVARSGLGTLNHTQLTLEALRRRHLEPRALFLVGEPHSSNAATLRVLAHVEHVYEVPQFRRLDTEALDAWLAQNDLEPVLSP
jgi:8-amino-7-oxononanoate synthase